MSKQWQRELSEDERAAVDTARRYTSLALDSTLDTYRHDLAALAKLAGLLDKAEEKPERRPELFTGSVSVVERDKSISAYLKRELVAWLR